jgi:pimeloyl-ACP methyl ester carboxylesterase
MGETRMSTDRDTLETQLLRIDAPQTGGIPLGLREMRPPGDRRLPPVLLLHGATFAAALFDLPRRGYSLVLRSRAPAVRSTRSTSGATALQLAARWTSRPGRTHRLPVPARPYTTSRPRRRLCAGGVPCRPSTLSVFRGARSRPPAMPAGHSQSVRSLALYAPLFAEHTPSRLDRIADPRDRGRLAPSFGAYRLVTAASVVERWNSDLPGGDPRLFREDGIAELVFETLAALDPRSPLQVPRAFRCPNGALADLVEVFNGRPLYEPAELTMPVLLIRGEQDTTSTATDAQRLLEAIGSP